MKKLFVLALAFAAFASCNKVESIETASEHISFGNAFVEVKTRDAVDPSTTTDSITAFDAWAIMDAPTGTVLDAERVTKNGDEWTYQNLQYWLADHDYYFYAVAPVDDTNVTVDASGINATGLGVINFVNENGTCDLLYAEKHVKTPEVMGTMPKVHLQFAHLLAKLKFTFVNNFTNKNARLAVKNVVITDAPGEGSIALNENASWNLTDGKTTRLEFGDVNDEDPFDIGLNNKKECATELLTIPADNTHIYHIEFTLVLYYGDMVAMESEKKVTLSNQAFVAGKHYNIVADINPENFDETALQPIEFTVDGVDEWDEGEFNGEIDWGSKPAPVALEAPVVTAAVDVNVVTLTWPDVAGAANYSVQVDDDVEEIVSGTTYTFTGDYEVEYTFTVIALPADTEVNLASAATVVKATTEAKPVVVPPTPTYTSVADFLAAAEDETIYTLKGTITSVTNTTYGNFYLNDGTGEVFIFGLCSPEGAQQYWAASGAKVGDDIVVKTVRTSYSNSPQGKNANFVELITPGTLVFWTFDSTAVSFTADGGQKTIKLDIYNTTDEVKAVSDNAQFSAAYADGTLTVTALENTSTENAVEGTITVTCGSLSQAIAVSQAKKPAEGGAQQEVIATLTFNDKAKRTTYTTSQQVWEENDIVVTNDKSSSTSNVGDYVNPARFYKNSKLTVTAPGNIQSIVFDCNSSTYANDLKSSIKTGTVSVASDKVTVILDGSTTDFVVASLGAQVRMDALTVTYLK